MKWKLLSMVTLLTIAQIKVFLSLSKLQGKAMYAMGLIALQNKFLRAW
ncbi:hypothetical protein OsI_30312 [Oryza sativa Indica Group]|uniref:Uncharacterized protein n=2 Tax=Oryza sativa TaxID=4530 RepID=B9FYL0_ORYSJ|nr:hypothetical protein OsI_30312 [Oryza sativa Indica Group]EEE69161.1 hypothetical protein OsJ_28315 [Oryza sativa Japonica Group]